MAAQTARAEGEHKHVKIDVAAIGAGGKITGTETESGGFAVGGDIVCKVLTDFGCWAQGGLTTLIGGGYVGSSEATDGDHRPGAYGEFFAGPTFRMQFGIFGIGISYLLGASNIIESTTFTTGPMIQFDFEVKNVEITCGIALLSWTGKDGQDKWHYPFAGLSNFSLDMGQVIRGFVGASYRVY